MSSADCVRARTVAIMLGEDLVNSRDVGDGLGGREGENGRDLKTLPAKSLFGEEREVANREGADESEPKAAEGGPENIRSYEVVSTSIEPG